VLRRPVISCVSDSGAGGVLLELFEDGTLDIANANNTVIWEGYP
jgi:hypothetical protein